MCKVSIITVSYQNLEGLKSTIESVNSQKSDAYEFIIIDGGSCDGSKELLQSYSQKVNYYVSEPDSGIYSAMNKGLAVAKGEYVIFMNSGDFFASETMLNKCIPYLTGEDYVYGDAYYATSEKRYEYKIPRVITLGSLLKEPICHQSAFIRRNFILKNGGYSEEYQISSDHIFNLQVFITQNPSQRHIAQYICVFDKNGISCTQNEKAQQEVQHFLEKNLSTEIQNMALEYDNLKKFYESKWGRIVRKIRSFYYRTRY